MTSWPAGRSVQRDHHSRVTAPAVVLLWIALFEAQSATAAAPTTSPQPAPGEAAEQDTIVTDRPDVAESSQTVGSRRLQLELGLDLETDKRNGRRQTDFRTPIKVRFGLLDRFELHLESDGIGYSSSSAANEDEAGVADLDIGCKLHLRGQDGWLPSTGLLLAITLPVGADAVSPDDAFSLSPTLAADWDLAAEWSLAINVGPTVALSRRNDTDDSVRYALAVGRSWVPLMATLGSYLELFGETALDDGQTALAVDGGFTWRVRANLQLDLTARVGLTKSAPDAGGALGFSIKF